jgi:hypothetical protein
MQEILNLLKGSSPIIISLVIIAIYLKDLIEKRLNAISGRIEEVNKTSLGIKKDIRGEERGELIEFRVALEKWDYFLQTSLIDYSIADFNEMQVKDLYKSDRDLFLDVKVSIVKSCIYLRNKELEKELFDTVINIRKNYYPLINLLLPDIIDLKAKKAFFDNKLVQFQKSGMKEMAFAPNEQDLIENRNINAELTSKLKTYADLSIEKYREIAVQLDQLKETMNKYIYRPIKETVINED